MNLNLSKTSTLKNMCGENVYAKYNASKNWDNA